MKFSMQKIQIFLAVSLTFLSSIDVQAQPANHNRQLNQSLIFAAPPPPKGIGEPGKRTEAGSRGCGQDINKLLTSSQKRLTALVPVYSKSELVFGTTITEHPSFLFYVPYASDFASGEFVLEDEAQNQTIYKTSLTGTPGIVNLRLPSKATPSQQVNLYAANGIWYEALSAASELRRTKSQDTSWTALLKAVGLNDFATEPKVECCNLKN
ncbi:MAG: DUF928 domain-containing protein [Nostoc sp.]|uniref:DUF928 domain-containing protein n=1 Tax=Nostoc sp. TaxID=1180 RepID=UPI002FFD3546